MSEDTFTVRLANFANHLDRQHRTVGGELVREAAARITELEAERDLLARAFDAMGSSRLFGGTTEVPHD